jgi:hypothetical protein
MALKFICIFLIPASTPCTFPYFSTLILIAFHMSCSQTATILMPTEISFEHFDPTLELGTLDENGKPIRPKKKPGRKPNPPSPAQRK